MNKEKNLFILFLIILGIASIYFINMTFEITTDDDNNRESQNEIIKESLIQTEFISKIKQDSENIVILDVRTKEEFEEYNINGSINIDYYSDNFKQQLNQLDKNKTYLIYCRSGNRSGETLKIMEDLGFKIIYDLNGGFINCNEC